MTMLIAEPPGHPVTFQPEHWRRGNRGDERGEQEGHREIFRRLQPGGDHDQRREDDESFTGTQCEILVTERRF